MKSFRISSYSLVVTIVIILMNSCSKEIFKDEPSTSKTNESIINIINKDTLLKNVGKYHNNALSYLYSKKKQLRFSNSELKLNEIVDGISEYLNKELGISSDSLKTICNTIKEKQESTHSLKKSDNSIFLDPENFIRYMESEDRYSNEFIWEIYDILYIVAHSSDMMKIEQKIDSFKQKQFFLKNDIIAQYAFINTFESSNNFWNNNFEYSEKMHSRRLKGSTWVIINDGIGGIAGSIFGGIGSIVVGTVFSAWTNEQIKSPTPTTNPATPSNINPPTKSDPRTTIR